eukprot:TRINITY_DN7775_c1_g1_i1.p1 TRINITY_DN7775_c1_g1~~TRINITY_DN7775_c1_g1_i1.p1  ORF type:complete len:352 (+),score=16.43 TRINITY_DN7775_c1_g1_i1:137-1192(+)
MKTVRTSVGGTGVSKRGTGRGRGRGARGASASSSTPSTPKGHSAGQGQLSTPSTPTTPSSYSSPATTSHPATPGTTDTNSPTTNNGHHNTNRGDTAHHTQQRSSTQTAGCKHLQLWKESERALATFHTIQQYLFVCKYRLVPPDKLVRPRCLYCPAGNTLAGSRIHVCLQCIFSACWGRRGEENHMKMHLHQTAHGFAVDIAHGEVYCNYCQDYIYDSDLDRISAIERYNALQIYKRLHNSDTSSHLPPYRDWSPTSEELEILNTHTNTINDPTHIECMFRMRDGCHFPTSLQRESYTVHPAPVSVLCMETFQQSCWLRTARCTRISYLYTQCLAYALQRKQFIMLSVYST